MNILVAYDVATDTAAGRKRLRKVALTCQDFGRRVQKSVFECSVNEMQYEEIVRQLLDIIQEKEDSLRFYRLAEPKEKYLKVFGIDTGINFEEPLIL